MNTGMRQAGRFLGCALLGLMLGRAVPAAPDTLPPALAASAAQKKIDPQAIHVAVYPLEAVRRDENGSNIDRIAPVLAYNADVDTAPASTVKLVTTLAALETLGSNYRWVTRFLADARPDKRGRINTLYVRGGGDPTFVIEDFALALDRLSALGIKHIRGNVVVDRTRFNVPDTHPGAFDGRASRPYNKLPDAAVINYGNVSFDFVPEPGTRRARVVMTPHLAGVTVPSFITLGKGRCGDWKSKIGYRFVKRANGKRQVRFTGQLPLACGAKTFNVISMGADEYFERVFRAYWVKDGRTWKGHAVSGTVPESAEPVSVHASAPLNDVTRLVNKWSNNLIARHIFLSLGAAQVKAEREQQLKQAALDGVEVPETLPALRGATPEDARQRLSQWLTSLGLNPADFYVDNGSGLSRKTRVKARAMAQMLALGWQGPYMSEYLSSLPITGVDGTMYRRKVATGYGRIKTGYLGDVRAVGGYVRAKNGRHYAVFATVNGKKSVPRGIAFLDDVITYVDNLP